MAKPSIEANENFLRRGAYESVVAEHGSVTRALRPVDSVRTDDAVGFLDDSSTPAMHQRRIKLLQLPFHDDPALVR
jgi:hypothetical protein